MLITPQFPVYSKQLRHCHCCPRRCRVDRLAGEVGFCKIGGQALVSHVGLHHGEEPPISGDHGSGTIFFAGCNLRCVFCQNHQISQNFQHSSVTPMSTAALADAMLRLQADGAHNINFVSPSHVLWQMADAIVSAKSKGLVLPIVYNSNGYDSPAALGQIRGLIDIYLPDLKYMDTSMAHNYSKVDDYAEVVGGVLAEMLDQVGHLELDDNDVAQKGLLVRHLVMPDGMENSKQCLRLLAKLDRQTTISLMSQYSPQHHAAQHPNINRTLSLAEYEEITDFALSLGLDNVFVQALSSQEVYLPDFDKDQPFAR
ncbi:MAG: radical SAM protein [Desulfobulbaceae bacterium]|nr:radical SAM protein [Desulfobulbaceae bacterium]